MAIENPLWMDPNPSTGVAPEYSARQDRGIIARLFTEGVEDVQGGNLLVAQRAAGANMTVEVAAGAAYVAGDDVARQGTYRIVVTSTETVTIGAAPASNSRIDLVVLRVRDATAIGGSAHGATVEVIAGVVAASPAAPAVPNTAIPLAQVLVAAGTTSITTSLITDRRAQAGANTLKVGTQPQQMTTAQRDALSGADLFAGRFIYNTTTGRVELYSSGIWMALGSCQVDVFTASANWTKPVGAKLVHVICIGPGASGRVGTSQGSPDGGPGGGYHAQTLIAAMLPASVPVTVSAGAPRNTQFSSPQFSGNSEFGGYVGAYGGNAFNNATGGVPIGMRPVPYSSTGVSADQGGYGNIASGSVASSARGGGGGGAYRTDVQSASDGGSSGREYGGLAGTLASLNGQDGTSRSGTGLAGSGGGSSYYSANSGPAGGGGGGIPGGGGGAGVSSGGPGGRGEVIAVTIF